MKKIIMICSWVIVLTLGISQWMSTNLYADRYEDAQEDLMMASKVGELNRILQEDGGTAHAYIRGRNTIVVEDPKFTRKFVTKLFSQNKQVFASKGFKYVVFTDGQTEWKFRAY
jgi:hypothetical protein